MGLFTGIELNSLEDLFVHDLKDLYDAEMRLVEAIPRMIDKATCEQLQSALSDHLEETRQQVLRLERVFRILGIEPKREKCEAMQGLITEAEELLSAAGDSDVINAAIIGAAQRIEHYEISGYGTACSFARQLGHEEIAELLDMTLQEEGMADKRLTEVAEESVNPAAASS